jgi:hypothetical protein
MLHSGVINDVYKKLTERKEVINLHGSIKDGLDFVTTKIIEQITNSKTYLYIDIDINAHINDGNSFLNAVSKGLYSHAKMSEVETHTSSKEEINFWLTKNSKKRPPLKIILIIKNLDKLSNENVGINYNDDFMNYLNSLKHRDYIYILFTSEKKINGATLYVGGKVLNGSKIDISNHTPIYPITEEIFFNFFIEKIEEKKETLKIKNKKFKNDNYFKKISSIIFKNSINPISLFETLLVSDIFIAEINTKSIDLKWLDNIISKDNSSKSSLSKIDNEIKNTIISNLKILSIFKNIMTLILSFKKLIFIFFTIIVIILIIYFDIYKYFNYITNLF